MNKGGFSWKRLLGITAFKQKISRTTGIPISKTGLEAKIGRFVVHTAMDLVGIKHKK